MWNIEKMRKQFSSLTLSGSKRVVEYQWGKYFAVTYG